MILPIGIGAVEWASQMSIELSAFGPIPILGDEADWRWWALWVVDLPAIVRLQPPDPYAYEDWISWASRFVELFSRG